MEPLALAPLPSLSFSLRAFPFVSGVDAAGFGVAAGAVLVGAEDFFSPSQPGIARAAAMTAIHDRPVHAPAEPR